jgi:hypothetical protein
MAILLPCSRPLWMAVPFLLTSVMSESQSYFTSGGLQPKSSYWRQALRNSRAVILFSKWTQNRSRENVFWLRSALPNNGSGIFAYLAVVAQQRLYTQQYYVPQLMLNVPYEIESGFISLHEWFLKSKYLRAPCARLILTNSSMISKQNNNPNNDHNLASQWLPTNRLNANQLAVNTEPSRPIYCT